MPLSERHTSILLSILREHIKTAKAVGSETLADKYNVGLSSASVRNVMMELEENGYLHQPHTSAGRVPTTKAYRYYVDHFLTQARVPGRQQEAIREALQAHHVWEQRLKAMAKVMSDACENTVFVGFGRHDVYYTGLSHLFHQPEFSHVDPMLHMTEIVDRLDDMMATLFDRVDDETTILLGKDNPFGEETGALMMKFEEGDDQTEHVIGILGPVRMPYDHYLAILQFTKDLIEA